MKSIHDLPKDIYALLESGKITQERAEEFGRRVAQLLVSKLGGANDQDPELRMSNFGNPCERQLWYKINCPEDGEPINGQLRFKFMYGDLIEELVLFLSEEAGHSVEGRQDKLEVAGVKGHRDGVVDGVLVDVKSSAPRGMDKFKTNGLKENDPFGYIDQLGLYLAGSQADPALKVKGEGAFIAVDKVDGEIVVDTYKLDKDRDWAKEATRKRAIIAEPHPPKRPYDPVPFGKSGNMQLAMPCRYCAFKKKCWPELRVFEYSTGPAYLTKVVVEPNVEEIK